MNARRFVWPDAEVQRLAREFIPVADDVAWLQEAEGPEGDLFRKVAEQGHYADRSNPAATRQGIYALKPDGTLLASVNSTESANVARMLRRALAARKPPPPGTGEQPEIVEDVVRPEDARPSDGLILYVFTRDLPRGGSEPGARSPDWNQDFAWFRKEEARRFLPEKIEKGATHRVPKDLLHRLARFHLIDNVRGQTLPYLPEHIERASLSARVARVEGNSALILMRGSSRVRERGKWTVKASERQARNQERGFEAVLLGMARFDTEAGRFTLFELVALGTRWGGTRYNARGEDLGSAPMGILFRLAGDGPGARIPPAHFWAYGW